MKNLLIFIFCISFGIMNAQETVTLFIEDGNDDAWQLFNDYTTPTGEMFIDQEQLSLGFDIWGGSRRHHIGLRYLNIPILPGSTITSAYIQFTSLNANPKSDKVYVRCEKNPSPSAFTTEDYNISSRVRTDTLVEWHIPEWQEFIPGPAQKTPNLKLIVQEAIDHPEWVENKPIVFLFLGLYIIYGPDTVLPRQACSWEYMGVMYAPFLTITYYEPALVEEINVASAMNIFPNPVLNTFTVSFTELPAGHYEICLYDLTGQQAYKVHEGQLDHGDHEFSLSAGELNLQAGVYFVSLSGEAGNMVRKIVVKD
jgi:hypothetical protein